MNANEAKMLTRRAKKNGLGVQLEKVHREIELSAKEGNSEIWYYGTLGKEAKDHLRESGFSVEYVKSHPADNLPTNKISWN